MSIAPFFISGMATALVSTCLIVTLRPYFWKMPSLAAIYALTSSTTGTAPRVMEVIDPEQRVDPPPHEVVSSAVAATAKAQQDTRRTRVNMTFLTVDQVRHARGSF